MRYALAICGLLLLVSLSGCERRTANELYQDAELALAQGKQGRAVELLQTALKKNPRHEKAHYRLGRIHLKNDDAQSAIYHLEQAAQIDPDEAKTQFRLGDAYLDLGETDQAIEALDRAIALDASIGGSYVKMAQAYRRKKDESSARLYLKKGLQNTSPDDAYYDDIQKALK